MIETLHIAAQYLATAAISFIEKKDDDSHTNLGWKNHSLVTHAFPNGDALRLNYKTYALEWQHNNGAIDSWPLDEKTHQQTLAWLTSKAASSEMANAYSYNLHYDLPYPKIVGDTVFKLNSQEEIDKLMAQRDLAQASLETVLKSGDYQSSIRIWPHHFDTGAFVTTNAGLGIGLGMAIPDTLINDFYLYVSAYKGHDAVELPSDTTIGLGRYYNNSWKGFALPVSRLSEQEAISFFSEAMACYLRQ